MFNYEAEMIEPAAKWLRSLGVMVRAEFVTPWGICDLVGASFDRNRVKQRLALCQTRPVGSITRAAILCRIPDVSTGQAVTLRRLVREYVPAIPEEVIIRETDRLVSDRYVVRKAWNRLQKQNGWVPLQQRLIALELKLSRIDEAMTQALNNLGFADESYVGLPKDVALRVASNQSRWASHFDRGIGLLAVASRSCKVLLPARQHERRPDSPIQFYSVEKFWRTYPKDS